jgi:hypothetical protein
VEEASRLFTVKEQRSRSIGTATFPVLRSLHPCPECFRDCKPPLPIAPNCAQLRLIAPN